MAAERREHRIALEILYAVDVGKAHFDEAFRQARNGIGVFSRGDDAAEQDPYEPVYPAVDLRSDAPRSTDWGLVERMVSGSLANKSEIEAQIAPLLQRWTLDRLSGIDRLIIMLGAWELQHRSDVEGRAAINHAVELARRLSGEKSAPFVNGVLDAFMRTALKSRASLG